MIHTYQLYYSLSKFHSLNSDVFFRYIWVALISVILMFMAASCDETPGTDSSTQASPSIVSLELSPDSIGFNSDQHSVTDTTITFNISAAVNSEFPADATPQFSVFNQGNLNQSISQGKLSSYNEEKDRYEASFQLELTTTDIKDFIVYVYYFNDQGQGNRAQYNLTVRGMAQNPPEILSTSNPDTVVIPDDPDEQKIARFTATVIDPEGQDNIDRVLVDIVNEDGALAGGEPFRMYDDGETENSGDLVASDSVYTRSFEINSNNNPQNYTLRFYAFDKTGLGSDTVSTSYVIVN